MSPGAYQIMLSRVVDYQECIQQKQLELTGGNVTDGAGVGEKTGSFPGYAIAIIVLSFCLCVLLVLLVLTCMRRHGNRHTKALDLQAECDTQPGGSPTLGVDRRDQSEHTNSRQSKTPALTCMYYKTANGTAVRKKGKVTADQHRCLIYENKSLLNNNGDSSTVYSDDSDEVRETTSITQGIRKDRQISAEELVINHNLLTEGQKDRQLPHLESIRDPNMSEERRDIHVHVHMHPLDSIRNPTLLTELQNDRHIPLAIARDHSLLTTKGHKDRQLSPPEFARDPTSTLQDEDEKNRLIPSLEFATDLSLPDTEGQKERQVPPLAFATDPTCSLLTKEQKHRQVAIPRFDRDTSSHAHAPTQEQKGYRKEALIPIQKVSSQGFPLYGNTRLVTDEHTYRQVALLKLPSQPINLLTDKNNCRPISPAGGLSTEARNTETGNGIS